MRFKAVKYADTFCIKDTERNMFAPCADRANRDELMAAIKKDASFAPRLSWCKINEGKVKR